eukprot:TRINITY_DN2937_c0_g1_i2.p1 TRINITY_DN2937_c0_g1~~TRINITY_DN2937_c0_g1_i2.p1  ORF type:complete len:87 (-),score=15.07 TRINITY_DN2937_c0_g1_i2:502-732(-)
MDGSIVASTQTSILEQQILSFSDLKIGMKLEVKVVSIENYGVLVNLTPNRKSKFLKGSIPNIHLSDTQITKPHLEI